MIVLWDRFHLQSLLLYFRYHLARDAHIVSVRGCAREHSSIYIYIHMYIYELVPKLCYKEPGRLKLAVRALLLGEKTYIYIYIY